MSFFNWRKKRYVYDTHIGACAERNILLPRLAAFSFIKKKEMKHFYERVPDIGGLEMLLLWHPPTPSNGRVVELLIQEGHES